MQVLKIMLPKSLDCDSAKQSLVPRVVKALFIYIYIYIYIYALQQPSTIPRSSCNNIFFLHAVYSYSYIAIIIYLKLEACMTL